MTEIPNAETAQAIYEAHGLDAEDAFNGNAHDFLSSILTEDLPVLKLVRIGSHSDLFR